MDKSFKNITNDEILEAQKLLLLSYKNPNNQELKRKSFEYLIQLCEREPMLYKNFLGL